MTAKLERIFILLLLCVASPPLLSETRYVSKTGSNEPPYTTPETAATTIQAALDEAGLADVIMVEAGDYVESITIQPHGVRLIGAGRDSCRIIVPEREDSVGIVLEGRRPELRGLAVLGGEVSISVRNDQDYLLIADCLLEGASEVGLSIRRREDVTVLDTLFQNVPKGIYVDWGGETYPDVDLFVSGCEFIDTGTGIHGSGVSIIAATQCTFLRNRYGIYGGWGVIILVCSCSFLEGSCGISAMTADGVMRVSNSVFAFNSWEAIETDQRGLVTDCLFYATYRAFDEWDGGYKPEFIRCTFVSNWVALGQMPVVVRDCIFWNNGQDVPRPSDGDWPQMRILDHCLINNPNFAGKNGNISGDPGFVGWGVFNDTDNPMHVDASAPPEGDGSPERPFSSLQEAVVSFDFRLREDSVCVGAGALGGDIGYSAGMAPAETPRSDKVAIEMAPRRYEAERFFIPPRMTVCGVGDGSARPSLHAEEVLIGQGARISGLDFEDTVVEAREAELSDCELQGGGLCLYGASVAGSRVLGGRTYLAYGSPWGKIRNCLFAKSGDGTAVNLSYSGGLHEFVNCTIDSPDVGIRLWDYYRAGHARLTNCIVAGRVIGNSELLQADHCLFLEGWPGEGNIAGDPIFMDAENGDFRLRPESPCIDAGDNNAPGMPDRDIAGMHRIIYGGKNLTVDMGAYEYYINDLQPGPEVSETRLTWSSLADESYSVFYSDDLSTWHLADGRVPAAGNTTTSWIDDGSNTGLPPSLAPRRFYRILENP